MFCDIEHHLIIVHYRLLQLTNGDVSSMTGLIGVILTYLMSTKVSTCENGSTNGRSYPTRTRLST